MSIEQIPEGKKIYFASDFHLGAPTPEESLIREKKIIRWLDSIRHDVHALFLVGDIFDFWFEYKHAIPKGCTRFLGKIAEFTDAGIPVYFFTGNHDMWMFDYLEKELNVTIYRDPVEYSFNGTKFLIGHGDGLGPGDHLYKTLKKIFSSSICQWLFARLHPNLGIGVARAWSLRSRASHGAEDKIMNIDNEWLLQYCKEYQAKNPKDYYIFGHRHLPMNLEVDSSSRYINLGEWISDYTYVQFDGKTLDLLTFEGDKKEN